MGQLDRTTGAGPARTGREYLRVSYDRSGRERSQDEQHDDNARAAAGFGVELLAPYREAGSASASRYAHKARGGFTRLLTDLDRNRFGADVLVLWESSRGSRKVGEWVTLIEACEAHGVTIFVTTHGREYRPDNARDRRSLLEDAVDAEYESSKTSSRIKRAAAANASAGRPHGPVPFGYVRRYDERTRLLVGQEPHPDEAPIVRELFARLRQGHAFLAIARDFRARGLVNDSGRPWTAAHLRSMAINPAYAGLRVHQSVQGKRTRGMITGDMEGVSVTEGIWEPLVSRADFLVVQKLLSNPKRVTTRPGRARHFLSMIARCSVCEGPLTVTYRRGVEEYQCQAGHVRTPKAALDERAEVAILAFLGRPDVHEAFSAGESQASKQLETLRDELAAARNELKQLRTAVGAGRLSVASLVAAEPGLLARVEELEGAERDLTTPSVLRGLITPGEDVAERWQRTPVSTRRAVARLLLSPDYLGFLTLTPRPPGKRGRATMPVEERIRWERTDSDQARPDRT
jgi:site-specific DNA recombinase